MNHHRLQRALARQGVSVEYFDGAYHLHNEHAQATVLLPPALPLEEKAVRQLLNFASVRTPSGQAAVCKACATPDFHPGAVAPVGSVVATPDDVVIPSSVGTDINCGMRLLTTGVSLAQLAPRKQQLVARMKKSLLDNGRDVPVSTRAFTALFDAGPSSFLDRVQKHGLWGRCDFDRLHSEIESCVGLAEFKSHSRHVPDAYRGAAHDTFRDPCLGTPGAGNHFVELQVVDELLDRRLAWQCGLKVGDVVVMIHSGSRDLGFFVGHRWMDRAREEWPKGVRHPESGLYALEGPLARDYLEAMGAAARYAWANRVVLAEMVRADLEDVVGLTGSRLVVDVPHNVVLNEQGLNIHRKGATPAHEGALALIPGSMGDASFLVKGLGSVEWLWSCSHGAGRAVRRQVLRAQQSQSSGPWECVTLRDERRIEEAPHAYKPIGPVISAQEEAGLIQAAVRLRPWLTFKA